MELIWVIAGGAAFVATHLGISATGLRGVLQRRYGPQAYLGIYSLLAFATLAGLLWAYTHTPHVPLLWPPLLLLPKLLMPVALFSIVGGFTVPNPTSVGAENKLAGDAARGLLRITRHPVQIGLLLWAASHLLANTDPPSIVFFGSLALVSTVGMWSMDRRKAGLPGWSEFAAVTSVVPFAAIAAGRNRLVVSELVVPLAIAAPLTLLLWWAHPYVSGGTALF